MPARLHVPRRSFVFWTTSRAARRRRSAAVAGTRPDSTSYVENSWRHAVTPSVPLNTDPTCFDPTYELLSRSLSTSWNSSARSARRLLNYPLMRRPVQKMAILTSFLPSSSSHSSQVLVPTVLATFARLVLATIIIRVANAYIRSDATMERASFRTDERRLSN